MDFTLLLAELSMRLRGDPVIASTMTFLLFASLGLAVISHPPLQRRILRRRRAAAAEDIDRPGALAPMAAIFGLLCALALLLISGI